jgi:hypothetical protein
MFLVFILVATRTGFATLHCVDPALSRRTVPVTSAVDLEESLMVMPTRLAEDPVSGTFSAMQECCVTSEVSHSDLFLYHASRTEIFSLD